MRKNEEGHMQTIAVPIVGNRISNRLDCSENILLVSIEKGVIKKRETIRFVQANPTAKINMLVQLGVDVLICDGITEFYSNKLQNSPIQVIPWISGEVEEVLAQYLEGKLPKNKVTSQGD
jgi:predicted Fe-Mo cluster-binding NifX family protein